MLHAVRDDRGVMFAKVTSVFVASILDKFKVCFDPKYFVLLEDAVFTTDSGTRIFLWVGTRIERESK